MPRFWHIFSLSDSGVEMTPGIPTRFVGACKRVDWSGGGAAVISPGSSENRGAFVRNNGVLISDPNRGEERRNFGTFLGTPIAAWKWLLE